MSVMKHTMLPSWKTTMILNRRVDTCNRSALDIAVVGGLFNLAMDKIINDIFIIKQVIKDNRGIFHGYHREGVIEEKRLFGFFTL